jgi:hypothetical protein
MNRGDVPDIVFLVHYNRHMVGEARSEERQEKNMQCCYPPKSHRHIQSQTFFTTRYDEATLES